MVALSRHTVIKEDIQDIVWRALPKHWVEFVDKIVEKTHLRGTRINYQSKEDREVMLMLFKAWKLKRPGQLDEYVTKIKSIRNAAKNRHITNDDASVRMTAFMPAYLDMLIKAVWREQEYDKQFYKWFLSDFKVFQVPEKL